MLPSHVRFVRVFVFRTLVISALIASLFAAGCTTGNSEAQLAIATLQGGLPMGSVSVGGGAYPPTTITATGGTAPYAFAVTSGSLPTGLALRCYGYDFRQSHDSWTIHLHCHG